ncbi:MAG: substrate-binding protein [Desulfocapsaceae bacterium]|nr:substrate-binding protein [Desulfocapsaceae bacterium]
MNTYIVKGLQILSVTVLFSLIFSESALPVETVLIGINVPLTGVYSKQGEDELRAYKLAIAKINKQGGILGKKIVYSVKDTQNSAEETRKNTKELIQNGAVLITGGSSSAEAAVQAEECQKAGVIFMAGQTHANEITGKDGHRHTFRWYNNAHQSAKALAHTLIKRYGSNARYAFIYADYSWGRSVLGSLRKIVEENGGQTILEIPTPLGAESYIAPLLKVKVAEPDVLVVIAFGQDMVNCLQQTTRLELKKKMAVVVPLMEINMAEALGPEIMQGVITTMCWYHGLAEIYPGSKEFVDIFKKEYSQMPGSGAAAAWVDILQYADAVERAQSFDHYQVIGALEDHHFTLLLGDEYWRKWDHQAIRPTFVAVGKAPGEVKDPWDLFTITFIREGQELARTREENPVQLEPMP